MKISWTPISANGFHQLTKADLPSHFVEGFEEQHQIHRSRMLSRFLAYIQELADFHIPMEIWLDGSFTTRCPEPDDIDLAILLSYRDLVNLTRAELIKLDLLLNERERVKLRYTCDVYHLDTHSEQDRQRWASTFATNHDGTPKGIFILTI